MLDQWAPWEQQRRRLRHQLEQRHLQHQQEQRQQHRQRRHTEHHIDDIREELRTKLPTPPAVPLKTPVFESDDDAGLMSDSSVSMVSDCSDGASGFHGPSPPLLPVSEQDDADSHHHHHSRSMTHSRQASNGSRKSWLVNHQSTSTSPAFPAMSPPIASPSTIERRPSEIGMHFYAMPTQACNNNERGACDAPPTPVEVMVGAMSLDEQQQQPIVETPMVRSPSPRLLRIQLSGPLNPALRRASSKPASPVIGSASPRPEKMYRNTLRLARLTTMNRRRSGVGLPVMVPVVVPTSNDSSCENLGPFTILNTLGMGTFSKVKLARHSETGVMYAVKVTPKSNPATIVSDPQSIPMVAKEPEILRNLHHPNLLEFVDSFETEKYSYLLTELVSGGELFEYLEKHDHLAERDARAVFRQLAEGVAYMHSKYVCHRDLKVENVLIAVAGHGGEGWLIKVADFGLATYFDPTAQTLLTRRCGSEPYAAPELILSQPYDGRCIDIWALGVILFCMLTGELPFDETRGGQSSSVGRRGRVAMYHRICRGEYVWPDARELPVSEHAKSLVRRMLDPVASSRATMNEILQHEWLSE